MPSELIPLSDPHLAEVVSLHLGNLHTQFHGTSGEELLRLYYKSIIRGEGATGFVALDKNKVAGFICGVWDPALVRKNLIQAYWPKVIWLGMGQVVGSPKILRDLLRRLITPSSEQTIDGYELRPIIVSDEFRGTGIGTLLLSGLLQDAERRGFKTVHLYTEDDNDSAIRFYEKSGFTNRGLVRRSDKTLFCFYIDIPGTL